ncbi:MAG: mitochondrial fission ELM1 family protein [Candidatus Omnitrophica bacterium]|nr:mitochondrial fission ELM1 family protein [Candidatus Omnitrophota bacterium]
MKALSVFLLVRGLSFVLGHVPLSVALAFGRVVAFICWFLHKRKWVAYANLRAAFPGQYSARELKRIVRMTYINLGQTFVELLRFPYIKKEYVDNNFILLEGSKERVEDVLAHNKGGIFLTAHLDNWELAGYYSAAQGYPLKVLVTQQKISKANELLNSYRELCGNTVIGKGMPLREMMQALQDNQLVAIVGDQGGDKDDMYLRFFGRLTATPGGAFRIAQKYNSAIIPCMMIREAKGCHQVHILEPLYFHVAEEQECDLRHIMQDYFALLEDYIRRKPEQWMWGHKRWKHCRTKRVAIVGDGKAGHVTQSKAVFQMLQQAVAENIASDGTKYEFELTHIDIRFKNLFLKKLFSLIMSLIMPFMRGRLSLLRPFFDNESFDKILNGYYDITISCGSSVLPISVLLKQENAGKNVLIMKPSFPYSLMHHDLIIKHAHDTFKKGSNIVETLLAPSLVSSDYLAEQCKELRTKYALKNGERFYCILIGGDTKNYRFDNDHVCTIVAVIKDAAAMTGHKIVITNSRRTRADTTDMLKDEFGDTNICPVFIDVNENNPENIVYGLIGVADVVFVSEESVSMISEAVQGGKKVFLLRSSRDRVALKHRRFHALLEKRGLIRVLHKDSTAHDINDYFKAEMIGADLREFQTMIQDKLRSLL